MKKIFLLILSWTVFLSTFAWSIEIIFFEHTDIAFRVGNLFIPLLLLFVSAKELWVYYKKGRKA